jgi:hypothetical protein
MPFVVGAPRSGTTLLRLMLDAHPELAVPPETWFLRAAVGLRGRGTRLRDRLFELVTDFPTWDDMHLSRREFRRALDAVEPFDLADGVRAFYRLYAERQGKPRWGDKTPAYSAYLGAIERLLPEARFVHLIRDGRDVAVSVRPLWFAPGDDIRTLARDWRDRVRRARRLGRGCRHYLEVRYEDLVRTPRAELERLAAFLELPYDPAMERYHESGGARIAELETRRRADGSVVATREQRLAAAGRAASRLDPSRVERWREVLSADERGVFEHVAEPPR